MTDVNAPEAAQAARGREREMVTEDEAAEQDSGYLREVGLLDCTKTGQGKRFRASRADCAADRSGDFDGAVRYGAGEDHRRIRD